MSDTVTIPKKRYESLIQAELFIDCLNHCGVDNWEWYDEACLLYKAELEKLDVEPSDDD